MTETVGSLLRDWRRRRRISQLELAVDADISSRHLSFIESGRSQPSRAMLLRLAAQLHVPSREQNVLLVAAGFAPSFPERSLEDPQMAQIRAAVDLLLENQMPFPAFALDRYWNIVTSNGALPELYTDVSPELLKRPVNALRLTLHPEGLAPRIENLAEWRGHLLARLHEAIERTADPELLTLRDELMSYPAPASGPEFAQAPLLVPLRLRLGDRVLSFVSTTMVFCTALEVTLSELAVESLFPADAATADYVRSLSS